MRNSFFEIGPNMDQPKITYGYFVHHHHHHLENKKQSCEVEDDHGGQDHQEAPEKQEAPLYHNQNHNHKIQSQSQSQSPQLKGVRIVTLLVNIPNIMLYYIYHIIIYVHYIYVNIPFSLGSGIVTRKVIESVAIVFYQCHSFIDCKQIKAKGQKLSKQDY